MDQSITKYMLPVNTMHSCSIPCCKNTTT